ncbi:MAG: PspC domain-containing protein [Zhaonellaceae bacterium]|jgi:phage shock protein C
MTNKIYRSERDKMIGGVCGGLAEYFNIDVVLIRLLWVLLFFLGGSGVLAYIIAWIIIPAQSTAQPHTDSLDDGQSWEGTDSTNDSGRGNKIVGIILIGVGVFFLAKMYIPHFYWRRVWPVVLIVVGVLIMFQGSKGEK